MRDKIGFPAMVCAFSALLLMAATGNIRWTQLRAGDRHGTAVAGQASDGTGATNDCPKYTADGSLTDSTFPCRFADSETPSGAVNGVNTTYTLANAPNPGASLIFINNGLIQVQGTDYTLSGSTITTSVAPLAGHILRAWYRY